MREIKFRAWEGNRRMDVLSIDFVNPSVVAIGYDIVEGEDASVLPIDGLEQFTGLNDKNGSEIYEGDIIEAHGLRGKIWFRVDTARYCCSPDVYDTDDAIIIGNIHENPELLK